MSPTSFRRRFPSPFYALVLTGAATAWLPLAYAFSFNIDSTPQQCKNLSISITGTGGTPPYRALVIPFGGSPLSNNVEARKIVDQMFDNDATSVSFQLKYPSLSQFVVVVSDSKTFGSGGTSVAATVTNSSDSSCYDSTTSVSPSFFYNLDPINQVVQCTSSRVWWNPSDVKGSPTFYGVIPGGDSFNITYSSTTTVSNEGTGFNWVPNVRGGTTLMVGAGDDRGLGAGGSVTYIVSAGNSVTSCLDSFSPSSTAGSPAGGSYPTSKSQAESSGSSSGGGSNTGAIAGGVVAGVVVILALILTFSFFRRRKRFHSTQKERPDLFTENERPTDALEGEVAQLVPPEPYIVPSEMPSPSEAGGRVLSEWGAGSSVPGSQYGYGVGTGGASRDRRISAFSASTEEALLRPSTPITLVSHAGTSSSGYGRKGGAPPVLRPVNVIQHEDAGMPPPDDVAEGEPETVELPPAYTNIRRDQMS